MRIAGLGSNRDLIFFRQVGWPSKFKITHEERIIQIAAVSIMTDVVKMREDAEQRHEQVLGLIETLSEASSSDRVSAVGKLGCISIIALIFLQITSVYSRSLNRLVLSFRK